MSYRMEEGYDITLVVTVRGKRPWSKPGGLHVRQLLTKHGDKFTAEMEHLISGPVGDVEKPADWRAVDVDYRVFEQHNPNRW